MSSQIWVMHAFVGDHDAVVVIECRQDGGFIRRRILQLVGDETFEIDIETEPDQSMAALLKKALEDESVKRRAARHDYTGEGSDRADRGAGA